MTSIFVSSKIPELEAEREIAVRTLRSLNLTVEPWEEFPAGGPPEKSWLTKIYDSQIFVLILWLQYSENVVKEYETANDLGIPILVFVKEAKWNERIEPDLKRFIKQIEKNYTYKPFRKLEKLELELKTAIMNVLCQKLKTPFSSSSGQDLFEIGRDIVEDAEKRVVMFPRTPTLIMGPRPYDADLSAKWAFELKFYKSALEAVERARNGGSFSLSLGYIVKDTRTLMERLATEETGHDLVKKAKERLQDLFNNCQCAKYPKSSFALKRVASLDDPLLSQFIVGDDRFAIWFKDPSSKHPTDPDVPSISLCVSSEDGNFSNGLVHVFNDICKAAPLDQLLEELNLSASDKSNTEIKKDRPSLTDRFLGGLEGKPHER